MKRAVTALLSCLGLMGALTVAPAAVGGARVSCARTTLVSVAHQDDDLLFVNPDLSRDYDRGACLRVVYLTAGDAGQTGDYVRSRENGVRAAYAVMAEASNTWKRSDLRAGGRRLRAYSLVKPPEGRGDIQLIFMGLPDGFPKGGGTPAYGRESLLKLFRGGHGRLTTVDGSARYDERTLIAALRGLIQRFRPDVIRTLDHHSTRLGYSTTQSVDHSDHAVTARYTLLAARHAMAATPGLRPELAFYRTYGISSLPANLTLDEHTRKRTIFEAYVVQVTCGPGGCATAPPRMGATESAWVARQYRRQDPAPVEDTIVSWAGSTSAPNDDSATARCLAVREGPSARDVVRTYACDGTRAQSWYTRGATLRSAMDGRCLTAAGRVPRVAACDGSRRQRWSLTNAGQVSTARGCLRQDDLLRLRARLRVVACDRREPGQRWFHAVGRARPPAP
ncbi:PIG-L family deacetylase [Nonomuraea recticatena]|uniref:PIG-L family deacetylase n=1 Tax=Nonomuraea recticatena TaxID=46178 RepID=UPI0031F8F4AC